MDDKGLTNYGGLLQFSEDDALLAAGVAGDVLVLNRQGKTLLRLAGRAERNHVPHVWCVAISRQAGQVAAGHRDGTVCVWSLTDGRLVAQRQLASRIVGGIVFAGLRERAPRRLLKARAPAFDAVLAITLGDRVALARARDLEVLEVMPGEIPPIVMRDFATIAADRGGTYVAAGRDNGDVHVWRRTGDGYEQIAIVQCLHLWVTRVLLHVEPAGPDEGVYVYAAAHTDKPLPFEPSHPASEISSWKFAPDGTYARVATSLTREVTDIALGRDRRIVLCAHRMSRPLFRYEKPPRYGLVSTHEHLRAADSDVHYLAPFTDGVLSVAVTTDLAVAFARDDTGRITQISPQGAGRK
jgi:WD domain, G-beta repeat